MTANNTHKRRARSGTLQKSLDKIETDPSHHLAGPFRPQTPLETQMPETPTASRRATKGSPMPNAWSTESRGFWADIKSLRWVVVPSSSLKLLLIVVLLWANWELLAPYVAETLPNPFAPLLFLSYPVSGSSPDDLRYAKGYLDFFFVAYYVVFWSFFRQVITINLCRPIARWFGIRKEGKLERFGEQGYALVYFAVMASWGIRIMSQLPTWWYRTEHFWIDYPHWDMKPELKRYYLMQSAYWVQQLMVLLLKLEKPRKDYAELVAHHFVTLWLVGWSYVVNLTLIGNAIYLSMDLPDTFLAFSKLLNYIQWEKTKIVSFIVFLGIWTYFRHWLNLVILYSVWTEYDLMPESSKRLWPNDGVWLVWWMKYQVFIPIALLQLLNLFWYYLILRILKRAVTHVEVTDVRSDDEDDSDDEPEAKED